MKKWLALFLLLSAAFTMVTANGKDEAASTEGGTETIDFYVWSDGNDEYSEFFDVFNSQDMDVKINPKYIVPADYESKLTTLLAGGVSMDAYMQKRQTDMFPQYNNGYIEPLNDLIESHNYDYSQIKAWDASISIDGNVVALPHRAGKYYTYYNVKPFEEKGLPTPTELVEKGEWTWDKFVELSEQLSENDGKTFGSHLYTWGSCQVYPAVQEGLQFITADGKVDVDESFLKSFQIRKTLEDGLDMPRLVDLKVTKTHYSQVFYTGAAPMLIIGEWFPGTVRNGFQKDLIKDFTLEDFRITRMPCDIPEYHSDGAATFGHVHAKSKKKDAAFEVLAWMASPAGALVEAKMGFLPPVVDANVMEVLAENVPDETSLEYFTEDIPVRPFFYNKYGSKVEQTIGRYIEMYLQGDISDADLIPEFKKEMQTIVDTTN